MSRYPSMILFGVFFLGIGTGMPAGTLSLAIEQVQVARPAFNPSLGQTTTIQYQLTAPARVTLTITDAECQPVRTLRDQVPQAAGAHQVTWDGRDAAGQVVPDEAYALAIHARDAGGQAAHYAPARTTGGEAVSVTHAQIDWARGQVRYFLLQPSRIVIRIGDWGGALVATPLDYVPRGAGVVLDRWDTGPLRALFDATARESWDMVIQGYTLWEHALLPYGHRAAGARPGDQGPCRQEAGVMAPEALRPLDAVRAVPLQLTAAVKKRGKLQVRVDTSPEQRAAVNADGARVRFFIDGELVEDRRDQQLPLTRSLALAGVSPGPHTLTVNVVRAMDLHSAAHHQFTVGETIASGAAISSKATEEMAQ